MNGLDQLIDFTLKPTRPQFVSSARTPLPPPPPEADSTLPITPITVAGSNAPPRPTAPRRLKASHADAARLRLWAFGPSGDGDGDGDGALSSLPLLLLLLLLLLLGLSSVSLWWAAGEHEAPLLCAGMADCWGTGWERGKRLSHDLWPQYPPSASNRPFATIPAQRRGLPTRRPRPAPGAGASVLPRPSCVRGFDSRLLLLLPSLRRTSTIRTRRSSLPPCAYWCIRVESARCSAWDTHTTVRPEPHPQEAHSTTHGGRRLDRHIARKKGYCDPRIPSVAGVSCSLVSARYRKNRTSSLA